MDSPSPRNDVFSRRNACVCHVPSGRHPTPDPRFGSSCRDVAKTLISPRAFRSSYTASMTCTLSIPQPANVFLRSAPCPQCILAIVLCNCLLRTFAPRIMSAKYLSRSSRELRCQVIHAGSTQELGRPLRKLESMMPTYARHATLTG